MTAASGKGIARLLIALMLALPAVARAQDAGEDEGAVTVGASADLVSSYVWRGIQYSNRANLQPSVWLDKGAWELGTWGSHEFKGDDGFHEQDFWLTYSLPEASIGSLAVTLNDYFSTQDSQHNRFLDYSGVENCSADEGVGDPPRCGTGNHTLEVVGSYSAPTVPIGLMVAYNFYNDPENALYSEASFTPEVAGFELGLTAGGVLRKSEWYYGVDKASFTNLGASIGRSLEMASFSIPLSAQIIRNPFLEETYYVLSAGVSAEF